MGGWVCNRQLGRLANLWQSDSAMRLTPLREVNPTGEIMTRTFSTLLCVLGLWLSQFTCFGNHELRGQIVDAESGEPLAARLYIQSMNGWHHAQSKGEGGAAVPYKVIRHLSEEVHTSLTAHPFTCQLPPGRYTLTAERGKEYLPATATVEITDGPQEVTLKLRRWTNMAERTWFSGETHVHRTIADLRTVVLGEDLNVALPLTYWVTDSTETPARNNHNREAIPPAKLIHVDDTHCIWPINTEYEIFTVRGQRNTLGAVFVLNHQKALTMTTPPVEPIVKEARRQGAILDLDKHNWPWSMMLLPIMDIDLFELTNNHIWRTRFMFRNWYAEFTAPYMKVEQDEKGNFTELGWIHFGLENYYTLLNCGFDIMPSAGTASGVHPVPLGFGRVYVHLPDGFSYQGWIEGLRDGRSFVTTGPMMEVQFNGKPAGEKFAAKGGEEFAMHVTGVIESPEPITSIELLINAEVSESIKVQPEKTRHGTFRQKIDLRTKIGESSWLAVRCFSATEAGRPRFAHTAPVHVSIDDQAIRPRAVEVEYLIKRVEDQAARFEKVLSEQELGEFQRAAEFYRKKLGRADDK